MPEKKCHVILFYCGPSDHKNLMMEIGNNLLRYVQYDNSHGAMFYSDSKGSDPKSAIKYKINLHNYCKCIMCSRY